MTFEEWLDTQVDDISTWREFMDEDQIAAAHEAWNAAQNESRQRIERLRGLYKWLSGHLVEAGDIEGG